ncbi:MAG: YgeY family selenium metabolism-linked hydrolase, partial [Chloroflexota bacterium]|nr:YgeY family selenium metabolism-linked hydrolase [Chloroflexota bacterium]
MQSYDIDLDRLADFTLRLIGERSPSGEESGVAKLVYTEMEQLGFDVRVDAWGNVIGTVEAGPGSTLLIDSHTDTVGVTEPGAWTRNPWGEIAGGRIYGRGSMDMKGPLAASVYGAAALQGRLTGGRVVVSASVAEEMVEGPALVEVARQVSPDYVIICEATSLRLARGQRGRAEIRVQTHGRPTHSSRPDLGVNAAEAMVDVAVRLRRIRPPDHPILREGILVLTDILSQPYPGLSVVPDACVATYDRRTLPGETEKDILAPVREAIQDALSGSEATGEAGIAEDDFETYTGVRVQAPNFAPAWFFGEDSEIVRRASAGLRRAGIEPILTHYAFCTNGSGTAGRMGIPTVGFGPGEETLAHRVDESIELDQLLRAARGYA